jgi:AraC family ethanolamine operon transcriptional activator
MHQDSDISLQRLLQATFSDVEEMCTAVRSWNLDFRPLYAPIECGDVGRMVQQRCGPLEFGYARFFASIEQRGAPPVGALTFGVLGEGVRRLWWRGQDVDAGTVLVFPVGGELRSFSSADFEVFTLSVDQKVIACLCECFKLSPPPARLRSETFRPPRQLLAMLRRRLRRLRDEVGCDGILEAKQLTEELVLAWLRASTSQPEGRQPMRVRDRAIQKCLQRIEQADWTELTPGVLCEIGGVGERTLQYAFRERFDLTPAAFLKMRRLAEVRRRLLRPLSADVMVGDIAAALGFWHVGQFASDYRRAFGETPSQTLRRSEDT